MFFAVRHIGVWFTWVYGFCKKMFFRILIPKLVPSKLVGHKIKILGAIALTHLEGDTKEGRNRRTTRSWHISLGSIFFMSWWRFTWVLLWSWHMKLTSYEADIKNSVEEHKLGILKTTKPQWIQLSYNFAGRVTKFIKLYRQVV